MCFYFYKAFANTNAAQRLRVRSARVNLNENELKLTKKAGNLEILTEKFQGIFGVETWQDIGNDFLIVLHFHLGQGFYIFAWN